MKKTVKKPLIAQHVPLPEAANFIKEFEKKMAKDDEKWRKRGTALEKEALEKMSPIVDAFLRDMFASYALGGMLSHGSAVFGDIDTAIRAYDFADAMLEARKKKPKAKKK
jgi:hypothetical protein